MLRALPVRLGLFLLLAALATCARPAPSPALWLIRDADSRIWLFGTVHVLAPDVRWRSAVVNAAFAEAETLTLETDVNANPAAFGALVRTLGAQPRGQSLSASLDAPTRALLTQQAARLRLHMEGLDGDRPWLAALELTLADAQSRGADAAFGVEAALQREADARGLRRAFLEAPEDQVHALADLSEPAQRRFLAATLAQLGRGDADDAAAERAWATGDTQALARVLDRQFAEAGPDVRAALITNRNRRWSAEIARLLEGRGDVFIAVGAAHLVGEDSVIALLRAQGIAVEGP